MGFSQRGSAGTLPVLSLLYCFATELQLSANTTHLYFAHLNHITIYH